MHFSADIYVFSVLKPVVYGGGADADEWRVASVEK